MKQSEYLKAAIEAVVAGGHALAHVDDHGDEKIKVTTADEAVAACEDVEDAWVVFDGGWLRAIWQYPLGVDLHKNDAAEVIADYTLSLGHVLDSFQPGAKTAD